MKFVNKTIQSLIKVRSKSITKCSLMKIVKLLHLAKAQEISKETMKVVSNGIAPCKALGNQ